MQSSIGPNSSGINTWFQSFLKQHAHILGEPILKPDKYRLQISYTQIERNSNNQPSFKHHYYGNPDQYFYPASTVKLPVAVMALERINELNIIGLTRNTAMTTEAWPPFDGGVTNDTSSESGKASVAHYIKKILLVSDNDAYNRLYEWLGPDYINRRLREWGFYESRIVHRLEKALTPAQNRFTPAVHFVNERGDTIYTKPAQQAKGSIVTKEEKLGKGYYTNGNLLHKPMDFSTKNSFLLQHLHRLVQWIMFPESQPANNKLRLSGSDYHFLRTYMAMLPGESRSPDLDTSRYWPSYVKFLLCGSEPSYAFPQDLRIFNKVGDAYGFLIDGAYIVDRRQGVEFLLSAVVYCNSDEILNDDRYDYESVGYPFLRALGRLIFDFESQRKKKFPADLQYLNPYFPPIRQFF